MNRVFYLGGPGELKEMAKAIAQALRDKGHVISSTWHDVDDPEAEETALRDFSQIEDAEEFILLNPAEWAHKGTGGRHVEFGYAVARGKDMIVLGSRTNIFHRIETIRVVEQLEDV
jgi:nucleoside 2-deoxyribosyltransferase